MTKYKEGEMATGHVTGILSYGAFVSLDEYYNGLIHISEISDHYVRDISDYLKIGDTISAKVIAVDEENCHVKLSIKEQTSYIEPQRKSKILEVGSGFGILKEHLDVWIEKSYKLIEKEKCKKNKKNNGF